MGSVKENMKGKKKTPTTAKKKDSGIFGKFSRKTKKEDAHQLFQSYLRKFEEINEFLDQKKV